MLAKFGIQVAREEAERVDTFRYSWEKIVTRAVSIICINFSLQALK